jgi:hypothetical protein
LPDGLQGQIEEKLLIARLTLAAAIEAQAFGGDIAFPQGIARGVFGHANRYRGPAPIHQDLMLHHEAVNVLFWSAQHGSTPIGRDAGSRSEIASVPAPARLRYPSVLFNYFFFFFAAAAFLGAAAVFFFLLGPFPPPLPLGLGFGVVIWIALLGLLDLVRH